MGEARRHRTILAMFQDRVRQAPDADATVHLRGEAVVATTWAEWDRRSRTLAAALMGLRVRPGERVAVLSSSRVEFAWLDVAAMMAGLVTVPIFPTESPQRCAAVLRDSGAKVVVAEDPLQVRKLMAVRDQLQSVEWLVVLEGKATQPDGTDVTLAEAVRTGDDDWILDLASFQSLGEERLPAAAGEIDARIAAAAPEDLVALCYTPGTEGEQKGVMVTHGGFTATAAALAEALPLGPDDVQLLYLPLAQAFARLTLMVGIQVGMTTAFARSYKTVIEDCRTFAPSFLCGVPRLFEGVQRRLEDDRLDLPGIQRVAVDWALKVAAKTSEGGSTRGVVGTIERNVAEKMVFAPMRDVFGGRLRFAVSGGAPLHADTARFFHHHGVEVVQGYGMTETCACTHVDDPDDQVVGTVGRPLSCVECRLAEDGEILVRGDNVTPGYWSRRAATEEVLDAEGWLHTGDLGTIDADGRLTITDRKRDVIITAAGKAIAPRPIADALRGSPLVGEVIVHGDGRAYLSALITLDRVALDRFAKDHGLDAPYEELTRSPVVFAEVERHVAAVNEQLPSHEAVRKFAILDAELTAEQGELTPTRRVRRRVATARHRALLDSFYSEQY